MTQVQTDVMDPARADALAATLGISLRDPLPPYFHSIYFWDIVGLDDLGTDGHPKLGLHIPDLGYPRRMWAGGRLTWHAALRAGQTAERRVRIDRVTEKQGRSGRFAIVTQRIEVWQNGILAIEEEKDLFYRPAAQPGEITPSPPDAPGGDTLRTLAFTPTQLFRYSALTFNGHRIHYDQPFTDKDFSGPSHGLIVHGPLLAQYLMLAAEAELGPLQHFTFQANAPVRQPETVKVMQDGERFWIAGESGALHMTATAKSHE